MAITKIVDFGTLWQTVFGDASGTLKTSDAGLDCSPIGALGSAVRVGAGASVRCYNNSNAVVWVKFGAQGVAAPTGYADGLPIPINSMVVYNSGASEWIISNAATTFGYTSSSS
jgi:hypothetical protein